MSLRQKITIAALLCLGFPFVSRSAIAANPIVENVGMADPEVRVYDDRVYLYGTHDAVPGAKKFIMHDWWVWTSDDLVHWKQVSTLKPEQTYYKKPSSACWATNAIRHNGKYYFYFSRGPAELGVVVGDSPAGPWTDPLGKPFVATGLTPTMERDPGILQEDDGTTYVIFGCWNYYMARLNDDMITLAEKPRKVEVAPQMGPYGAGKLDDKPIIFKRDREYYLAWGCYYGMADNVYGPYAYKDSILHRDRVEPIFQKGLTFDRHGSFFELHNQWYFICNDQSWPGTCAHYRDSVITYLHFRDNGEIEPVYLNRLGVGQYDAKEGIDAANYFSGLGVTQKQSPDGGFEVRDIKDGTVLIYPNVMNLPADAPMSIRLSCGNATGGTIEVRSASAAGPLLGQCAAPATGGWDQYQTIACPLNNPAGTLDLYLVFRGPGGDLLHLKSMKFQ